MILYAENAYNEETGSYDFRSFPEFINMCEYFFERYQYTTVLTTLYPVAEMPVNQSAGAQTVALAPVAEIRSLVSQDFDPETVQLNVQLDYESVDAPVEAGTVLGSVTVLLATRKWAPWISQPSPRWCAPRSLTVPRPPGSTWKTTGGSGWLESCCSSWR